MLLSLDHKWSHMVASAHKKLGQAPKAEHRLKYLKVKWIAVYGTQVEKRSGVQLRGVLTWIAVYVCTHVETHTTVEGSTYLLPGSDIELY